VQPSLAVQISYSAGGRLSHILLLGKCCLALCASLIMGAHLQQVNRPRLKGEPAAQHEEGLDMEQVRSVHCTWYGGNFCDL